MFSRQPLAEHYTLPPAGGALVRSDPELGWTLRPGFAGVRSGEAWQDGLSTNAMGFRDAAHGRKEAGVTRVLVLGDSFVFGSGVKQDEALTHVLGQRLGPAYEVVNLGVPGYGTDQALLTLRRWGPRLSPDIVLAGFFWNDVMENSSREIYGMEKPRFERDGTTLRLVPARAAHAPTVWSNFDSTLRGRSELWSLLRRGIGRGESVSVRDERPVMVDLSLRNPPANRETEFALTWALLAEIAREARELGAAPLVFTIPPRFLADENVKSKVLKIYDLPPDALVSDGFVRLKTACEREGVPVADLLPAFRAAASSGQELFLPGAGIHWSAAGHALAAATLEESVRAIGRTHPAR